MSTARKCENMMRISYPCYCSRPSCMHKEWNPSTSKGAFASRHTGAHRPPLGRGAQSLACDLSALTRRDVRLLGHNGEYVKVVLLRHATSRITVDVYQHAKQDAKRAALTPFSGIVAVPQAS